MFLKKIYIFYTSSCTYPTDPLHLQGWIIGLSLSYSVSKHILHCLTSG